MKTSTIRGKTVLDKGSTSVGPGLPVALGANSVEQFVVNRAVLLEIEAQIQQRLGQQAALVQLQRDEEATKTSVAIQKGVDGLELHMG